MAKRILAISGGGIFGLLPALILEEIERVTGKACADLFDLVAGTSTGGIIACGIAVRVPASQLVSLYEDHGAAIFAASFGSEIEDLDGLTGPKYSAGPLETILKLTLGAKTLQDAETKLLVPASRCDKTPSAHWFKSWGQDNFLLWQVARATSAAPYYFPCAVVDSAAGEQMTFVDGGLFANNPEDYAADCASILWPRDDLSVLSLGTGSAPVTVPVKPDWGGADWASSLIEFMMQCSEEVTAESAALALGRARVRLDPPLGGAMDDTSPDNIRAIKAAAASVIAGADFQAYVQTLAAKVPA